MPWNVGSRHFDPNLLDCTCRAAIWMNPEAREFHGMLGLVTSTPTYWTALVGQAQVCHAVNTGALRLGPWETPDRGPGSIRRNTDMASARLGADSRRLRASWAGRRHLARPGGFDDHWQVQAMRVS
jgi:hypothetical protein